MGTTTTEKKNGHGKAKQAEAAALMAQADLVPTLGKIKIAISQPPIHLVEFTLCGDNPLIIKRFSEKAGDAIAKKKEGLHVEKTQTTFEQDFQDARHIDNQGRDCIKASAFKGAIVSAATFCKNMKSTRVLKSVFVMGDLLPIEGDAPIMRTDVVRNVSTGGSSLCARPEYKQWSVRLKVRYVRSEISLEQVMNLFSYAGVCVGVGERRPEREGATFGTWHVDGDSIVGVQE